MFHFAYHQSGVLDAALINNWIAGSQSSVVGAVDVADGMEHNLQVFSCPSVKETICSPVSK